MTNNASGAQALPNQPQLRQAESLPASQPDITAAVLPVELPPNMPVTENASQVNQASPEAPSPPPTFSPIVRTDEQHRPAPSPSAPPPLPGTTPPILVATEPPAPVAIAPEMPAAVPASPTPPVNRETIPPPSEPAAPIRSTPELALSPLPSVAPPAPEPSSPGPELQVAQPQVPVVEEPAPLEELKRDKSTTSGSIYEDIKKTANLGLGDDELGLKLEDYVNQSNTGLEV